MAKNIEVLAMLIDRALTGFPLFRDRLSMAASEDPCRLKKKYADKNDKDDD